MPKLSHIFLDNPQKQDIKTHKKFQVMISSEETSDIVVVAEIYLRLDWLGHSDMHQLDLALKALQIKRDTTRIYWQNGVDSVMPIFNYMTLLTALTMMAEDNNILYIIKKEQEQDILDKNMLYKIDPYDKTHVLQISSTIKRDMFTCFTRFEETTSTLMTTAARGEHLPTSLMKEKAVQSAKKDGQSAKPDKASKKTPKSN